MHKHAVTFNPHYCWRSSTLHKTDDGQYLPVLSQCFHLLYVPHGSMKSLRAASANEINHPSRKVGVRRQAVPDVLLS